MKNVHEKMKKKQTLYDEKSRLRKKIATQLFTAFVKSF